MVECTYIYLSEGRSGNLIKYGIFLSVIRLTVVLMLAIFHTLLPLAESGKCGKHNIMVTFTRAK